MPSAADRAYDHLRMAILSEEYGRGCRLPEEQLARGLGMSRTPVREALRRLSAEGLVVIDMHRGAQVATWTEQDVDEIYSIRALVEGQGARLAAGRIGDAALDTLRELAGRMEETARAEVVDAAEDVTRLNFEFHRTVLAASGSSRLEALFCSVTEFPVVYRAYQRYSPGRVEESLAEHRTLLRALVDQDGEWAEAVMRAHVLAARAEQRRLYRDMPPELRSSGQGA